jgi:uncharacterized protein YbjT (DUF2867 family)
MILVTGANGTVGGAVLAALTQPKVQPSGQQVRAMYRSEKDSAPVPVGAEAVTADFADQASLAAALRGVESVYLVCSPIPQLAQLEANMIEACQAAGVRRIVLNSAMGAADYPKSFPSWHRKVEDQLTATTLSYCILRPNSFLQNILAFYAPLIRAQGAFYAGMESAKVSFLDVDDIAAVAASALHGGEHDGKTYELNGPEAFTYTQVAEKIAKHSGVPARYVDIPVEAQRKAMLDQGMPDWQITALLDLQAYYTGGQGGATDGLLARLLGRPPVTLDQFLEKHSGKFRPQAASA